MKAVTRLTPSMERLVVKPLYMLVFFLMALTGFAQMPIFKRYYIADIPGLGWLDRYYVTHTLHYLGAIVLLALIAYAIAVYLAMFRKRYRLTVLAHVRMVLLAAIVCTGIFRVLKNLPEIVFSPGFTMFIDIAHLAFMMLYILVATAGLMTRSGWLKEKQPQSIVTQGR
jgi:hypothetical protein